MRSDTLKLWDETSKRLVIRDGNLWQVCDINRPDLKGVPWYRCYQHHPSLCGLNLRRPHLTCIHCLMRRQVQGEIPREIRVSFVTITWIDRKRSNLKMSIFKRLLSIALMFITW